MENGVKLVKYNRKGKAAFRSVWMESAAATDIRWCPATSGIGSLFAKSGITPESANLRNLTDVRLGEEPDPEVDGQVLCNSEHH